MPPKNTFFSKERVASIIKQYAKRFPFESISQKSSRLLKSKGPLISRKNFDGHVTAAAIVFNRTLSRVLTVHHRNLDKLLQPGGHVDEADGAFWRGALREFSEETGFTSALYVPFDKTNPDIPVDINVHLIPENPKRNEKAHYHHDFRYVFVLLDDIPTGEKSSREVENVAWKSALELQHSNSDLQPVIRKAYSLVAKERDSLFFEQVANQLLSREKEKINVVAVLHIIPDILHFASFLQSKFSSVRIVPKPNSISKEVIKKIPKDLIYRFNRKEIQNKSALQKLFPPNVKSYVIDIGGYFANDSFLSFNKSKKRVFGIVEDTENGFKRYEKIKDKLTIPVVSVARSDLKNNEDELVGYSVAYYTEMVVRTSSHLPRYMTCGIIGYGKLGKGVAKYFFSQDVKPFVYDKDPIRMVEAYKDGCVPLKKDDLLSRSQLVISATGSSVLNSNDFSKLRPGAFVGSVTSSEDEFDLSNLSRDFTVSSEGPFLKKYENGKTYWHLLNDGNAMNFIDRNGDHAGNFIRLVQAELALALGSLVKKGARPGLHEISKEQREGIARHFLDYYVNIEDFLSAPEEKV